MKAVLIYLLCLITIGCFSQQSQVVVYELYFNGGLVETFYSKAELYKFIDREKEKHRIDDNPFWGSLNNSIYKQYMEKFKVKMRRGDGVVLDLGDVMNFNPYKQELDALKEQEHEFDYDSLLDDIPLRLSTERKQGRINSTKLNDLSNLSDMSTPALENCAILSSCYENIIDTVWIDYAVKNTCDDLRDSASGYLGWDSKKIESYLIEAYKGLSGEECFDKIISLDTTSLSESEKVVCMEYNEFARRVFTKLEEIKKRPKVLDNQLAEGDSFKDVKILAQIDPQSSLWGDPRISSDFAPIDADLLFTEYKKREMEASKIEQTDSDLWGEIVEGMTAQRFSSVIGSLMVY